MAEGKIFVIDDEENICRSCAEALREESYEVRTFTSPREALDRLAEDAPDLVLLDLKMPELDGISVLKKIKQQRQETTVIIATGYGTVESAVASLKLGAFDYVSKPFTPDELTATVGRAFDHRRLVAENRYLREELSRKFELDNMIGESPAMKEISGLVKRVAPTDSTVLINGESGTGKELVARAIHANSRRQEKNFVVVDCASLAQSVIESELFGYVKGAFTGAAETKQGLLEIADGGTIFLDEVSNINLDIQAKLLRVIQEQEFKRVGDSRSRKVNIRFVAATNRDLEKMISENLFREDLFYRLDVFRIYLPPLRERREDIPLLARYFLDYYSRTMHKDVEGFSPEALRLLEVYDWPGNIREMKNMVERLVIMIDEPVADSREVAFALGSRKAGKGPAPVAKTAEELKQIRREATQKIVDEIERAFIVAALKRSHGNVTRAAEEVGLLRPNFHALMRKHHVNHEVD